MENAEHLLYVYNMQKAARIWRKYVKGKRDNLWTGEQNQSNGVPEEAVLQLPTIKENLF